MFKNKTRFSVKKITAFLSACSLAIVGGLTYVTEGFTKPVISDVNAYGGISASVQVYFKNYYDDSDFIQYYMNLSDVYSGDKRYIRRYYVNKYYTTKKCGPKKEYWEKGVGRYVDGRYVSGDGPISTRMCFERLGGSGQDGLGAPAEWNFWGAFKGPTNRAPRKECSTPNYRIVPNCYIEPEYEHLLEWGWEPIPEKEFGGRESCALNEKDARFLDVRVCSRVPGGDGNPKDEGGGITVIDPPPGQEPRPNPPSFRWINQIGDKNINTTDSVEWYQEAQASGGGVSNPVVVVSASGLPNGLYASEQSDPNSKRGRAKITGVASAPGVYNVYFNATAKKSVRLNDLSDSMVVRVKDTTAPVITARDEYTVTTSRQENFTLPYKDNSDQAVGEIVKDDDPYKNLPKGLTFGSTNNGLTITGVPAPETYGHTYKVKLRVKDTIIPGHPTHDINVSEKEITIKVNDGTPPEIKFNPDKFMSERQDELKDVTNKGEKPDVGNNKRFTSSKFEITDNSKGKVVLRVDGLPNGVTLQDDNRTISGIPSKETGGRIFDLNVSATDESNNVNNTRYKLFVSDGTEPTLVIKDFNVYTSKPLNEPYKVTDNGEGGVNTNKPIAIINSERSNINIKDVIGDNYKPVKRSELLPGVYNDYARQVITGAPAGELAKTGSNVYKLTAFGADIIPTQNGEFESNVTNPVEFIMTFINRTPPSFGKDEDNGVNIDNNDTSITNGIDDKKTDPDGKVNVDETVKPEKIEDGEIGGDGKPSYGGKWKLPNRTFTNNEHFTVRIPMGSVNGAHCEITGLDAMKGVNGYDGKTCSFEGLVPKFGNYGITVKIIDAEGNYSVGVFDMIINDVTPPEFTGKTHYRIPTGTKEVFTASVIDDDEIVPQITVDYTNNKDTNKVGDKLDRVITKVTNDGRTSTATFTAESYQPEFTTIHFKGTDHAGNHVDKDIVIEFYDTIKPETGKASDNGVKINGKDRGESYGEQQSGYYTNFTTSMDGKEFTLPITDNSGATDGGTIIEGELPEGLEYVPGATEAKIVGTPTPGTVNKDYKIVTRICDFNQENKPTHDRNCIDVPIHVHVFDGTPPDLSVSNIFTLTDRLEKLEKEENLDRQDVKNNNRTLKWKINTSDNSGKAPKVVVEDLPKQMKFDKETNIIFGVMPPEEVNKTYTVKFSSTDDDDNVSKTKAILTVVDGTEPKVVAVDQTVTTDREFSAPLGVVTDNADAHPTVKVTGLPEGLVFDNDTYTIKGTPTPESLITDYYKESVADYERQVENYQKALDEYNAKLEKARAQIEAKKAEAKKRAKRETKEVYRISGGLLDGLVSSVFGDNNNVNGEEEYTDPAKTIVKPKWGDYVTHGVEGKYTVKADAVDESGNVMLTKSFTITVKDGTKPHIAVPDYTALTSRLEDHDGSNAEENAKAALTVGDNGTSNNSDRDFTWVTTSTDNDLLHPTTRAFGLPKGLKYSSVTNKITGQVAPDLANTEHTVKFETIDASGNRNSVTAKLKILDGTEPMVKTDDHVMTTTRKFVYKLEGVGKSIDNATTIDPATSNEGKIGKVSDNITEHPDVTVSNLPKGMFFDPQTYTISGTPDDDAIFGGNLDKPAEEVLRDLDGRKIEYVSGNYRIGVKAKDAADNKMNEKFFNVIVRDGTKPKFADSILENVEKANLVPRTGENPELGDDNKVNSIYKLKDFTTVTDQKYIINIPVSDNSRSVSCTVYGLPVGARWDTRTCTITGITHTPSKYPIAVKVNDADGNTIFGRFNLSVIDVMKPNYNVKNNNYDTETTNSFTIPINDNELRKATSVKVQIDNNDNGKGDPAVNYKLTNDKNLQNKAYEGKVIFSKNDSIDKALAPTNKVPNYHTILVPNNPDNRIDQKLSLKFSAESFITTDVPVTITITDLTGNKVTKKFNVKFEDNIKPEFVKVPDEIRENTSRSPFEVEIEARDSSGQPVTIEAKDLPGWVEFTTKPGTNKATLEIHTDAPRNDSVTIIVTDQSGNKIEKEIPIIILDDEKPELNDKDKIFDKKDDGSYHTTVKCEVGKPCKEIDLSAKDNDGSSLKVTVENLPDGLHYDDATKKITGTVTKPGKWETKIIISDGSGNKIEILITFIVEGSEGDNNGNNGDKNRNGSEGNAANNPGDDGDKGEVLHLEVEPVPGNNLPDNGATIQNANPVDKADGGNTRVLSKTGVVGAAVGIVGVIILAVGAGIVVAMKRRKEISK